MRILVVEDEAGLRDAVVRSLREDGYAVDEACNGQEGLSKARIWEYDAIVLDLMLPGMDGWTFLSHVRDAPGPPVLIVTARDSIPDRVRGLDSGADDYLVKPFALSELSARLRALIRRSAGQSTSLMVIGSVEVDTAKRQVTRDGEFVELTAREYSLVELLALHRGEVVTRSNIFEHLFDENEDTNSNLIEVHVHNIRKKLGKGFITTRRGLGYVVDD